MHPNVYCSTICNRQNMKSTEMFINRGMDQQDVVQIYNGTLLNHKQEQNNATCSNMDGLRDCHTE